MVTLNFQTRHNSRIARPVRPFAKHRLAARPVIISALIAGLLSAAPAHACSDGLADVVAPLLPAVVNVATAQANFDGESAPVPAPQVPDGSPFDEFFSDFFSGAEDDAAARTTSLGSGFVIDQSGLIVTNNHVIAKASAIEITFANGDRRTVSKIVGTDAETDIALLQVETTTPLPAVRFALGTDVRVGECVVAIGNPFGLGGTVTSGIVSGKKRAINSGPFEEFLQTDAAINQGNSGGPLFNRAGEVIGINTAIISPGGRSVGIGFAIPAATAAHVVDQLRQNGRFERGWIGVRVQTLSPLMAEARGLAGRTGAIIAAVTDGGPAQIAGLRGGDIVTAIDGVPITDIRAFMRQVRRTERGTRLRMAVNRAGSERTVGVTIARAPAATLRLETTGGGARRRDGGRDTPMREPRRGHHKVAALHVPVLGVTVTDTRRVARADNAPDQARRDETASAEQATSVVVLAVNHEGDKQGASGLRRGDTILEIAGSSVATAADLLDASQTLLAAGEQSALLLVARGAQEIRFVSVPLRR